MSSLSSTLLSMLLMAGGRRRGGGRQLSAMVMMLLRFIPRTETQGCFCVGMQRRQGNVNSGRGCKIILCYHVYEVAGFQDRLEKQISEHCLYVPTLIHKPKNSISGMQNTSTSRNQTAVYNTFTPRSVERD